MVEKARGRARPLNVKPGDCHQTGLSTVTSDGMWKGREGLGGHLTVQQAVTKQDYVRGKPIMTGIQDKYG